MFIVQFLYFCYNRMVIFERLILIFIEIPILFEFYCGLIFHVLKNVDIYILNL